MKTYSHNILAALAVSACLLTGCFEMIPDSDKDVAPAKSIARAGVPGPVGQQPEAGACTYSDRKTERVVTNESGVIMRLNETTYVISADNQTQRYTLCDLPDALKHDGMKVKFSGNVKEIYANERWMANPFELTDLSPDRGE
jgi:hypothetical protein